MTMLLSLENQLVCQQALTLRQDLAVSFRWRDRTGAMHAPEGMETRHLFFTLRMIWNNFMPPYMRVGAVKLYAFGPSYTRAYLATAVVAISDELGKRDDLTADWKNQLHAMRTWFAEYTDAPEQAALAGPAVREETTEMPKTEKPKPQPERKILEREIYADVDRLYVPIADAIAYLQEVQAEHPDKPGLRLDEHWTGYEDMEMRFVYQSEETDEEYNVRLARLREEQSRKDRERYREAERKKIDAEIEKLRRKRGNL